MNTSETKMKLSEAIRLGATLKPQWFARDHECNPAIETCAIQAAFEAMGALGKQIPAFYFWPLITSTASCPECSETDLNLDLDGSDTLIGNVIIHLNDYHRWTRERIADWVATIESQQEQQAAQAEPAMEVASR